jgi:hypothetical protein
MIGTKNGESINDVIKGPISLFGAGIVLIGVAMAMANDWSSQVEAPDESILFGGFLTNLIYEINYYMFAIIPLVVVVGAIMVALQLMIRPAKNYQTGDDSALT